MEVGGDLRPPPTTITLGAILTGVCVTRVWQRRGYLEGREKRRKREGGKRRQAKLMKGEGGRRRPEDVSTSRAESL
jgi:heme exporter protein D